MIRLLAVVVCTLILTRSSVSEDLGVLEGQMGATVPHSMMCDYFLGLSQTALEKRIETYEALKTPEDCAAYQERLRQFFVEQLGGWPARTPLNARVVASEDKAGYRLEKIIYESRPNSFVTALLRLPLTEPPYPGVLVPCGHSSNGKACEAYQRASILLARNGIASLCYDPIGQGERHQILSEDGKVVIPSSTIEHTSVGVGAILVGMNTATFRIWDGMRGIDYLVEREDIDPERIGCTGNSGGGTLTSYIMALDPRVKVAAPSCYVTSFERLLVTCGPQDAEQNIHAQIAFGMNHADYVLMRAPNPTLMCCATKDYFDITGSWDAFRQAKRFYSRLGFSERVDLIENDDKHGFNMPQRVAMVRWMRRWLLGIDDAITEPDVTILTDEQALCTPTGQVLELDNACTVWDIMADREAQLAEQRSAFWADTPREKALDKVRQVAGIRPLAELTDTTVRILPERVARDGYTITKFIFRPEPGVFLPALVFATGKPSGEAFLYLHGADKEADAVLGGPIEALVKKGHIVMAVDLRGVGETECEGRHKSWAPFFGMDWQDYFGAYLLGKSYVGMRTEDIFICGRFLATYLVDERPNSVHMIGIGEAAVPALHAAALEPALFASVTLDGMVTSWADTVRTPVTDNQLINTVHNALATYDLPDLLATLPADKVTVVNPTTP